jgi:hypothetical protein
MIAQPSLAGDWKMPLSASCVRPSRSKLPHVLLRGDACHSGLASLGALTFSHGDGEKMFARWKGATMIRGVASARGRASRRAVVKAEPVAQPHGPEQPSYDTSYPSTICGRSEIPYPARTGNRTPCRHEYRQIGLRNKRSTRAVWPRAGRGGFVILVGEWHIIRAKADNRCENIHQSLLDARTQVAVAQNPTVESVQHFSFGTMLRAHRSRRPRFR